jgi:hypothetical protein
MSDFILGKIVYRWLHALALALGNLFKFQPLGSIRDYFGEQNAIYFGFVGSFITMLWIPALVGIVFFVLGLSFYYRQVKDIFKAILLKAF